MKKTYLDPEEKQIVEDYEEGRFVSVSDFKEKKKLFEEAAKNTFRKTKNINIRLTFKDL